MSIEDFRHSLEHEALDKIHAALRGHTRGLTAREIADHAGLAVGRVQEVLNKSQCVLKRRPRHPTIWFADWKDVPVKYRPKRGRPKTLTLEATHD